MLKNGHCTPHRGKEMCSMEDDLNTVARAAFESRMIGMKARGAGISGKIDGSSEKKAWNALPEWIRGSRMVQGLKSAYLGSKGENEYIRICMMSFMNYALNKRIALPKNADKEYSDAVRRVLESFVEGASGGPLAWKRLYDKELDSKVKWKAGAYEFEGKRLPRKMFLPEVYLRHHGLKQLPQEVVARIRKGSILDVGAAIGDSTAVLSDYTDKRVYSFECNESFRALLSETIRLNGLKNVVPMEDAIGRSDGKLWFDGFPRDFYFHHEQKRAISMDTRSIDSVCSEKGIEGVSLIKMDIEGFELEALQGAEKTIARDRPVIIASVYHTGKDFFEIPLFLEKIHPDYRFRLLFLNDNPPTKEINLVAY